MDVFNKPLPGDLVIREDVDASRSLRMATFVICTWPRLDASAGRYQSYGYALERARALAEPRQVQIWREVDCRSGRLENASE